MRAGRKRGLGLFAAMLLAGLLTGCVAGPAPDIATSPPVLPGNFYYAPDAGASGDLETLLPVQDPAFADLSAAAIADGPSLAEALARVEAARAGADRAGAARLPEIRSDASVNTSRINPSQFSEGGQGFIDPSQTSYGANVTASWNADLFGVLKAQERAALARIDAATASAEAVRIALIAEIASSVIDWRTLDRREEALERDLAAAQQLAQLSRTREEAGLSPGFDRVRAEASASQSRARIAALANARASLMGRLVTLTGQPAANVVALLDQSYTRTDLPDAVPSLPSLLLANRPDVVAAAANLAARDADLAAAARRRFPQLSLSGALGLLSFDLGGLFDDDAVVYSGTAGLLAPLVDFGRIQADIDASAAEKRASFAQYRGAVFTALGDAESAYALVAAADAEVSASVQQAEELDRAAALANTRYRAGLADFLTVLDAQRAADTSGENAAAALGRASRARVILWQALGGDSFTTLVSDQSANSSQ